MSTSTQVEAVSTGAEKAKLLAALALVFGALFAFYWMSESAVWQRVGVLLVLLVMAAGTFFVSDMGKRLIAYGQESVREVRKVVWPTPKEAGQMTLYVFIFVVLMALFLWLTDVTLSWILYDLILGWKN